MSLNRRAKRRDNNEPQLKSVATSLGWWLISLDKPVDFLGYRRGQWHVIEIKNPDCEGHADEFTPEQQIFHADAKHRQAPVLIWRTVDDVLRSSGAK